MKKAKEHANELVVAYSDGIMSSDFAIFEKKVTDVWSAVAFIEVRELQKARSIKSDTGLIPIFKEQRNKYGSICKIVNTVKADLLSITDFDRVIAALYPDIYEWYVSHVL